MHTAATRHRRGLVFLTFFGVLLPVFTLTLELLTRVCANTLLDPAPDLIHVALILIVPLANGCSVLVLWNRTVAYFRPLAWLNGVALGVAISYCAVFLPVTPFALMGIAFLGFGLLPLAPFVALLVQFILRYRLRNLARTCGRAHASPAQTLPAAAVAVLILVAPPFVNDLGINMALNADPATRLRGIRFLRQWGAREGLLDACDEKPGLFVLYRDLLHLANPLFPNRYDASPEDLQAIYFRVTGTPYTLARSSHRRNAPWRSTFDRHVGSDVVADRIDGVSLAHSRIDGTVYPNALVAYLEWTIEFRNATPRLQEARCQIALPPGAVVSRLTLWIDGQEREAAFGGRTDVSSAYRNVVERKRDPVLVTTSGTDKVLLQCFPIPPNGGTMKTRVGMTIPLALADLATGRLRLPCILARNFGLADDFGHDLWIESPAGMTRPNVPGVTIEQPAAHEFVLRGELLDRRLLAPFTIEVERDAQIRAVWSRDERGPAPQIIQQKIGPRPTVAPTCIVVVLDGSRPMREALPLLQEIWSQLPSDGQAAVLLAADEVRTLLPRQPLSSDAHRLVAARVRSDLFVGGCDNVPALEEAWETARGEEDSVILWLHGAQPHRFASIEGLRQRFERRPDGPQLYELQLAPGPNKILDDLDGVAAAHSVARFGDASQDLAHLLDAWHGGRPRWQATRRAVPADAPGHGLETNDHLARLWAADEVRRQLKEDRARAVDLGQHYRLVTPVTGAVVLETQQQYEAAGLEPAAAYTSPHITPEPGTWMLLLAGALVAGGFAARRRMGARS